MSHRKRNPLHRIHTAILIACMLLAACDGGGSDRAGGESRSAGATVVLHLTGMLLLVPDGTMMRVRVPNVANHSSVLGIGIGSEPPEGLCINDPNPVGVCFVDLAVWDVEDFGAGGGEINTSLPSEILDFTKHWKHNAKPQPGSEAMVGEIRLLSGRHGTACSLMKWYFRPSGSSEDSASFANVLQWEVTGLTAPVIRVRRKSHVQGDKTPISIPIPIVQGTGQVVLANLPSGSFGELPDQTGTSSAEPIKATEIGEYHKLTNAPADNPPIPYRNPCQVGVTLPPGGLHPLDLRSPRTFSCMLATAQL
jgi:hypothetical protein